MRLVFAGTPAAAVPSLRLLLSSPHEVAAVLTRPDARAGRGRRTVPSPVKEVALEHGLEVIESSRASAPHVVDRVGELAPDACPVVAYGSLVREPLLSLPPLGWVNLHFSLLPAWRGAAPVQRALVAGDEMTGATTFRLDAGMDTGPVLGRMTEPVRRDDTADDLLARLAEGGAHLLLATLDALEAGTIVPEDQPADGVSHAPMLHPDEGRVRWSTPARAIDRHVRGFHSNPGAWTLLRGERVRLEPVELLPAGGEVPAPGEIRAGKRDVVVGTATGPVRLGMVRPQGKKPMAAADWARGLRLEQGERFDA